ncbi:hypothetical protein U0070_014346 [Myodes glareolus]|uniref:Uncharacterized protein n=1 Tax=Myodes glareolus TaxID=447135 RepID=A0AAW0IS08_MYOGA
MAGTSASKSIKGVRGTSSDSGKLTKGKIYPITVDGQVLSNRRARRLKEKPVSLGSLRGKKCEANGEKAHLLFPFLLESLPAPSDDPTVLMILPKCIIWSLVCLSDVAWNFEKFLVGLDGVPVRSYMIRNSEKMGKLTQSGGRYWTDLSEWAAEWPSSYRTESVA